MNICDHVISNILPTFAPSETALLDWLCPQIDDKMLEYIADSDHGLFEEEYFAALTQIRDSRQVPIPLEWCPREALSLTHWGGLDDANRVTDELTQREHLTFAFCTAVLIIADGPNEAGFTEVIHPDLILLVASALYLGKMGLVFTRSLLAWQTQRISRNDGTRPFYILALLIVCSALYEGGTDYLDLKLLADWVIE